MIARFAAQRSDSVLARAAIGLLSVILASSSLPVFPGAARAVGSDPIRYTYDAAGRLSGAIDPAAGSAAYGYDAAGNITSITREDATELVILEVAPDAGAVGTTAAIHGTGFSTTPSQNTVQFNGTTATVTSATTTELIVTVPSGATTGSISVTTSSGSATSPTTFVVGATAPTISSFSPSIGSIGSGVTVNGTNFEPSLLGNVLVVNSLRTPLSTASTTSLTATVPKASSGHLSVLNAAGAVTTTDFFFIAPPPTAPADIVDTEVLTVGGSVVSVTIGTASKDALIVFDGTVNQRVSFQFSSDSIANNTVRILNPDGSILRAAQNTSSTTYWDTLVLPWTGTFTLHVDATSGSTGSLSVRAYDVPADPTASATPGGSAVTQSTTVPGQNLVLTFAGTVDQRISMKFTSVTGFGDLDGTVYKPDGTVLRATADINNNTFYDVFVLPVTGTYTLKLSDSGSSTGSVTTTVYDVPADPTASATPGGSAVTQSTTVPGQNLVLTFAGTVDQRISMKFTSVTGFGDLDGTVYKPDGTVLRATADINNNTFYDVFVLPVTGTYTLKLSDSGSSTGSVTTTVYDVPADPTASATPGGSAVTQSTTVPGQNLVLTFAGTVDQRISMKFTSVTGFGDLDGTVYKPDGTVLRATADINNNTFYDVFVLPVTGTYTLKLSDSGSSTGSVTTTVYDVPADPTASATPGGSAVTQSTTVPGQNLVLTFAGTVDQRISMKFTSVTGFGDLDGTVYKPDGTVLRATADINNNTFYDVFVLPVTGTYTLKLSDSGSSTGSVTTTVYDPVLLTNTISIGGSAVTVTTTVPGQDAEVSFSGTSGQAIKLVISSVTISQSDVSIRKPDGSNLVAPTLVTTTGKTINATLTATGTHLIVINPRSTHVGSMTLTLSLQGTGFIDNGVMFASVPRSVPVVGDQGGAYTALWQPGAAQPSGPGVLAAPIRKATETRPAPTVDDPEEWEPGPRHRRGDWRVDRPLTDWQFQPNLIAPSGETALAGTVLTLAGQPLRGVTLEIDGSSARTDRTGRFLLRSLEAGEHELVIDGRTASSPRRTFGLFEARVTVQAGFTNILPFTIWMTKLDTEHTVTIGHPTSGETVVTTPRIPGLEVHIPAGSRVVAEDGEPVTEIGITAIPIDRPPFPLPAGVVVPVYFTIQPGGAYVWPAGAWIVYPNYTNLEPGTRVDFWSFDPDEEGWHIYGKGTVTADGQQVVPDPGVRIYEFSGAMFNGSGLVPPDIAPLEEADGDPVDLATGLITVTNTDLVLPDVIPVNVTRSYRQSDTTVRPFGRGTNWNFGLFLWSANQYQEVDLILPQGGRVHYVRTSAGTGWTDAVFETTATPNAFYKSTIKWNGDGWDLRLRDGTTYVFADNAPLKAIRDRYGNTVSITRENDNPNGKITKVTSPDGRWIEFTYDGSNRITQAKDNLARTVGYEYNAAGYLWKVTNPEAGVTEYTYDGSNRLWKIKDARGITFLTNQYDTNGRVSVQTQADSTTYQFAYTVDGAGKVTQTDVTNPRGNVRRVTFNGAGYPLADTAAFGTSDAQTTTYVRQASGNLPTSITDAVGRRTDLAYDASGNVTSVTRLAGTGSAVTTTMTYEPAFNQLASVTDPLDEMTNFAYDGLGRRTSVTNALNEESSFTYNLAGQVLTATDPTDRTTTFSYRFGDLVTITDPEGHATTRFVDAAGRIAAVTSPLGSRTKTAYNGLNRPTKVTNPLGHEIEFTHDANGNVGGLEDPRGNSTTFTFDSMDRLEEREDALTHAESYEHDENGNLVELVDREGVVTVHQYDVLDRRTFTGFGAVTSGGSTTYESTIAYDYDAGNRLIELTDSAGGTIEFDYDDLDRLTDETTSVGSVTYEYDDAGRRTEMTVAGQSAVTYTYDAHRVTDIVQGTETVEFDYDDGGRLTTMSLPNGVVATYAYDDASRVTGISYERDSTAVGDLTYTYDASGHRTTAGGSLAAVTLPAALSSATHDDANRLTAWGATSLGYDLNGNLISEGSRTYEWNARGELVRIADGSTEVATFAYDGLGRRTSKAIGSTSTGFAYDGGTAVQELSGSTATANLLNGATDQLFRRSDGSGARFPLTDVLGSTVGLTDSAGVIQTSYAYEPFGATTVSGAANANPTQFTGRENDATGLYYYRARYYHPTHGRFISEDPLGFLAGDPNPYAYVGNGPTNATDSSGLFWDAIIDAGFIASDLWNIATGNRKQQAEAWSSLGLNVVGLLIPGVIGLGRWDDVARGADEVAGLLAAPKWAPTNFRPGLLDRHFAEHAAEWGVGNITKQAYSNRARSLLNSIPGGDILGHTRLNGDILRYNARTNEFAVAAADGTIRTLFRPTDGMAYWLRQLVP